MAQDLRREWLENAVARWEKPILHLCYAYLGDTALAEDAVQETFFKAWKHYDRFRGEAEEKTWLMRIAMNHCKDQLKSSWYPVRQNGPYSGTSRSSADPCTCS